MAEYINRESIMKFPIRKDHCDKEHANEHFINGIETVLEYAGSLLTADVVPVVHGRWNNMDGYKTRKVCSECGWDVPEYGKFYSYCPNCGAKMDGGNGDAAD